MLQTPQDAYDLLISLGAPRRLILHLRLVGEAAEDLLAAMRGLGIEVRQHMVRLGVAVHDAGKIIHRGEIDGDGNEHETAGQTLLLQAGVQPAVARFCVSHARYEAKDASFEELLVALADKLWKGKRDDSLEILVIGRAAQLSGRDRWEIFAMLGDCFERIASEGDGRLARSR